MIALKNLFSSIKIGSLELKNRIVMAPAGTDLAAPDGSVSEALIRYHEARTRGGCGLNIVEVAIMAVMSVAAGVAAGFALNYAFSIVGIPIPPVEYGGVTFSKMFTEINTRSYVIPLLSVVLSATVVSVFPALKAARTRPAVAMRYH